ncbi:Plexin-D1 [Saguinus oedipus]|uniref:Plexin-D1 n=1 Tax=Saguinus oedipus TaxID=9490 RepID=A0ABQ9U2T2_SAGOE|nr:Plexin-D1 [Saguinus oedipus]
MGRTLRAGLTKLPHVSSAVVYNCATGSPDCSQCLGREDLGHLCVWSDGCRLRGPMQPLPGTCPAPEIREEIPKWRPQANVRSVMHTDILLGSAVTCQVVTVPALPEPPDLPLSSGPHSSLSWVTWQIEPLSGPLDGGTLLTIRGRNLGRRLSDVAHGVWIGGVAWPAPGLLSDVVTVNASKEGKSRDRFSYVLPLVHSLEPAMGPKAGGTRITIHGSDLHVGSELQVLMNDTDPCRELMRTDTSVACTVPEAALAAPVTVCVRFERRDCNVSMTVHHIGREPTLCKVLNSTLITCPSPGALSNASAPVDFFINGRAYADELAVAEELLDPEEAQQGSRFHLDYLPNPQFSTAKREKWIKHHPGEPLTLVIHKEQDSLGLQSHEYQVKIGQVSCDIQIVSDRVIHCSVNESLGEAEGQLPITIQVGNFNQTIATLQLGGSETAIIVSIVICSVLLLLSVVGKEPHPQDTLEGRPATSSQPC